jgi:hypothetical protein
VVVAELAVGLSEASAKQAPSVASLTGYARWLTIISWLTYPFVYIIKRPRLLPFAPMQFLSIHVVGMIPGEL